MRYFISWKELKDAFIICFRKKKNDREVIDSFSYLKEKRNTHVKGFFERVIDKTNKIVHQSYNLFKKM